MCVLTGSLLASFLVPGCSGSSTTTYPVRGLVRFPDGKLLREGTVEFETIGAGENITATGDIRPDGSFVLGTFSSNDGAVAGKHRAVVIADVEIGTGAERPGMLAPTRLDQKYRDFSTSGLQFDVQPGRNDIVIDVQYASALGTDE
ncbi:MAG: hypothetical protein HKN47_20315 [Pirellulaceae bacterium]|nr:hypothetical protein [Pirellulaceae bacterium]